jgi:lysozyme
MRLAALALSFLFLGAAGKGDEAHKAEGPRQPPQLLGVWYGAYDVPMGQATYKAEMWMEVAFQESENGFDVRGHCRWNVLDEDGEKAHGKKSLGMHAEYYDAFDGRIAPDGKSVRLTGASREGYLQAKIVDDNTLAGRYFPEHGKEPPFTVELKRVDSDYSPTKINVLGIDISHHSGNVDWQRVKKQGFRFAYVKATEGVDNPDALFAAHWQALREAGLERGAYHFYVTEDDPVEQAKFFASRLRDDPGTLPPAVDIELLGNNTTGDLTAKLLTFLRTVEQEIGVKPVIYTNSTFWDKNFKPEFSAYQLWMSEYGVKMPKVPFGWKRWLFWQTAKDRKVAGVEKSADISMIHPEVNVHTLAEKE